MKENEMTFNSADALREAGILGGTMTPELEEFYGSLSQTETEVLISTKNRLMAVLPEVVAHSQEWAAPEATQQGFDAAMLCACGAWSGSGNAQN
ncbi:StsA-related sactipeptide RiPP [Micromonosporaceae bacterium Da 78-11]